MPGQNRGDHVVSIGVPVTYVDRVHPDGTVVRWESRRHRKHLKERAGGAPWWAPRTRGWWIAVLFAIGSLLFAIGAIPAYASAVGARWDNVTFFTGSLFFTSAAFLTYREAVDAAPTALNPAHRRFFVYQPGRIDWWATGVQFIGTLFFNVSTGAAIASGLSAQTAHQHVWRPDAIGSACFLVSSFAGLVRGLPRLGRLAPAVVVMVDHAGQPGGVGRLRRLRRRRLRQPGHRPGPQRGPGQHPNPDRRSLLLHRRPAAAPGTHRGSQRPGDGTRERQHARPDKTGSGIRLQQG